VRVRWTAHAVNQLGLIGGYIGQHNPAAAASIMKRLYNATDALTRFPMMGHEGRLPGTRELSVPGTPYIIPYRIAGDHIDVLAVFHGAQSRDLP
jgi:addiction module RelE/StbE family toxin